MTLIEASLLSQHADFLYYMDDDKLILIKNRTDQTKGAITPIHLLQLSSKFVELMGRPSKIVEIPKQHAISLYSFK